MSTKTDSSLSINEHSENGISEKKYIIPPNRTRYLSEIADDSNHTRNQHLVCVIKQLLKQGERVFVICGSSHAVCIENEIN